MKRILVPIDFSSITKAVIQTAAQLAATMKAKLWLLHVAAAEPEFVGYEPGPPSVRHQLATRLRQEHRDLQRYARRLETRGISTTPLLIQDATVPGIVREARRVGADLIVLGSHGHGALYRALLGSVSEGVLREGVCPVLVVPARKKLRG